MNVRRVETGAIVRVVAPGSRESDGEQRVIPAIVTHQWPDGSLQLYCFHFQGSPVLANSVHPDTVEVVMSPAEHDALWRGVIQRLNALEQQVIALVAPVGSLIPTMGGTVSGDGSIAGIGRFSLAPDDSR